jgi:mono/diheme cytochrome c family protein
MNRSCLNVPCLLVLLVATTGCGTDDAEDVSDVDTSVGQAIYAEPSPDGNTFACATCHALHEPAEDGFTRPGHPIGDAANRPNFKNGRFGSLREAANTCRTEWMGAPTWSPDDAEWRDIEAFLKKEAGREAAEPLMFQVVDPPTDVSGGDAEAGVARFNETCVVCHGVSGGGTERAPMIAGTPLDIDAIAMKVRRSGNPDSTVYPDLIPGRMPFWQADRLSDEELINIVAFLEMSEPVVAPTMTADGADVSLPNAQSDCGTTHPAVGRMLSFKTNAHAVAGTATIVDDCTIAIEGFGFDGGGIDVHIYGGNGGDYSGGVDLSMNIVGTTFEGIDAMFRLPAGVTLDDFDGLSVWCVPVGFSFGDGLFQ